MTKPMTTITNDWETHTWTLKMPDGTEYDCKAYVYLTFKEVPDTYNITGKHTQVADYNLEGFDTLPSLQSPEHEKEIERQLLVLLEELYGQG